MKRIATIASFLLMLLGISCQPIQPSLIYAPTPGKSVKTAYVVINSSSKPERAIHTFIKQSLESMEIQTTIGPEDKKPNDVDIIVSYYDNWGWDYVFYLRDLKITMVDQKTKSVISSGNFENHALFFFHKYPDPKESVHGLIKSIFNPANKPSA